MNKDYEHLEHLREKLVAETNKSVILPFNPGIYKKSVAEKHELNIAKARFKALKETPAMYNTSKNQLLDTIVKSSTPRWGGIKLTIL